MLTISGINSEDAFRLSILTLMNTVNSFTPQVLIILLFMIYQFFQNYH